MTLYDACEISLSDFSKIPSFQEMCKEVEKDDICSPHHILGSEVDICEYVKKADIANQCVRKKCSIPTLEFVLLYICDADRVVPFSAFNDAAQMVMKKYNILSTDGSDGAVDEKTAMAAILMIAIGYELRKLFLIRAQILAHQAKLANSSSLTAPIRRMATAIEYAEYHIDMVDEYQSVPCRGFQFERAAGYYKLLDNENYEGSVYEDLSGGLKKLLDMNKKKNSIFLKDNPIADIVQVVYDAKGTTATIHSYGCFPKIA